jgi:hypothetical protein
MFECKKKDMQTILSFVTTGGGWFVVECVVTYQQNEDWCKDVKNMHVKMDSEGKAVKISLQKIIEFCNLNTAAISKIIRYNWNFK